MLNIYFYNCCRCWWICTVHTWILMIGSNLNSSVLNASLTSQATSSVEIEWYLSHPVHPVVNNTHIVCWNVICSLPFISASDQSNSFLTIPQFVWFTWLTLPFLSQWNKDHTSLHPFHPSSSCSWILLSSYHPRCFLSRYYLVSFSL